MDQTVVDQLSLDAIPYYQEQLYGALSLVLELQNRIEAENEITENIVVKMQDDNKNEIYQHVLDFDEKNIDDVIQEMNEKCLTQLEEIDQETFKQEEQIFTMNQKIDELEDIISNCMTQTNKDQVVLNQLNNLIKDKQLLLQDINLEIKEQEQINKQNQQFIKRRMKQEKQKQQELDEKMLLKQKKQEQKQLLKEKTAKNEELLVQSLVEEKQRLQNELDELINGQEQKVQQLLSQMETTIMEEDEKSIVTSVVLRESSNKSHYEKKEIQEQPKNRACCGECIIF
ncbi:unnamed protein product [Paramecium sonneborni]|uniref:Uncharacterized protein n=1 Tax=Paramecium sonneborni TaxID=65129 RepID=A0A8S1RDI8_9CILI|nr:unnamed protein product [Paramecium sonneborni]CAD8126331.1 unnamed protein product [Paramecium sonneborni]